jgi:hypothetical protein
LARGERPSAADFAATAEGRAVLADCAKTREVLKAAVQASK